MTEYTCIALLRGINVGGKTTLDMKALARIMEDMGFSAIQTYIRSGNIVFRSAKKPTRKQAGELRDRISAAHGIAPHVLFIAPDALAAALRHCPFEAGEGKALHFHFLDGVPAQPDLDLLNALRKPSEQFSLKGEVFYLHAPEGIARSKLAAKAEQALGVPATARNLNTVHKLLAMAAAD